jgi:hypothetical protein
MKTEQSRLVWRFIGCVAAIAVTVGVATLVSRLSPPLG